jgi:D-sedoheptulose 7-phosphate isomerase
VSAPRVVDGVIDLRGRPEGLRSQLRRHLREADAALACLPDSLATIERWATALAEVVSAGGRLLAAGNGGSAAHAQHLTSELVGRFREERVGYSAIALHADSSAVTALANDYGVEEVFARQVVAHGRPGDALALFSTSGRSPNLLRAAEAGERGGLRTLAVTGPGPNPLADRCHDVIAVGAPTTAAVQEAHQVVVHLLCVAFEDRLGATDLRSTTPVLGAER